MEFLLIALGLGLAAGIIAQNKGRSFLGYFVLGALLPIVGVALAIAVSRNTGGVETRELARGTAVKCPHCAELIKPEARVCRFCGRDVVLAAFSARDRDWEASEAATRAQRSV